MIDVKLLEKKSEGGPSYYDEYKASLRSRGADDSIVDQLLDLNKKRKELISKAEESKSNLNKFSQEIAMMKRKGEDATELIAQMQTLSKEIKDMEAAAAEADAEVMQMALVIPNKCHSSVPIGASENDNKIVRVVGEPGKFSYKPLEHNVLGEALGNIDFQRAGKVTGARFTYLRGAAAQLERALINFMLDLHTEEHGYNEILPPFIVNSKSLTGTGNLPKFKQDLFNLEGTDYFLIPTAEVPVTNFFAEEMLSEEQLPASFVAYSPCFRSEAGSHGRDTKGLIRQHQFNKVELMTYAHPNESYETHERLTGHAEEILKRLELPYRVSMLCTGDISFGAAKCYDLEVWLPGQNAYREISSCSNFEDFQARRANIRYRPKGGGKPQYVHTLNGSALAVGRTLVAIFENYQQEDGTIVVPKVLTPYMRGMAVIKPESVKY
jgi:seryl-tRNA synthetase